MSEFVTVGQRVRNRPLRFAADRVVRAVVVEVKDNRQIVYEDIFTRKRYRVTPTHFYEFWEIDNGTVRKVPTRRCIGVFK